MANDTPGSKYCVSELLLVAAVLVVPLGLALLLWLPDAIVLSRLWDDILVPWDAGARWHSGQWSSLDFPSSLGPVYYALQGWAFEISGGNATSTIKANVLAFLLTFPVLVYVLFSRFPPLVAAVALFSFGVWMMSPRQPDFGSKTLSYLASYNRHGLIWTALVLLLAALPWRFRPEGIRERRWQLVTDAATAGLLLLACAFSKITFAVFAGIFFVLLVFLQQHKRPQALLTIYGTVALVVAIGLALLEWSVPGLIRAYVSDIQYAASIQSSGVIESLINNRGDSITYLLLDTMLAVVVLGAVLEKVELRAILKPLCVAFLTFLSLALVMAQVHDTYAPIIAVAALVFFGASLPIYQQKGERAEGRVIQFVVIPCLLASAAIETASVAQFSLYTRRVAAAPAEYLGFSDKGLFFSGDDGPLPSNLLDSSADESTLTKVRNGLLTPKEWNEKGQLRALEFYEIWTDVRSLLAKHAKAEDRVFCLAFANGCPALTSTKPPSGLLLWWHEGRSFSRDDPPVGAIDDATLVAVPKVDRWSYGLSIEKAYAEDLKTDFSAVGESDFWVLMRRNEATVLHREATRKDVRNSNH